MNLKQTAFGATLFGTLVLGLPALSLQQQDPPGLGELGGPGRKLSPAELEQFLRGREVFDTAFHTSRGLGFPEMNADSCRACHQDPVLGGAGGLELNVSRAAFDNFGSGPFIDITGGQAFSKLFPPWVYGREEYDNVLADVFEQRQTPALFGDGLIDSIPEANILANEDPTDANMDGIFGAARMVDVGGSVEVGRFGWKAQVPHLEDFVRDAMGGELGLTTPGDGRGFAFTSDLDLVPDPELSEAEVDDLAFWLIELAPPQRTDPMNPTVVTGEALFSSIGCAECHVPSLMGAAGPVPLYSNLLLHNVMPSNYRGMVEPGAGAGFFKTPPLWGIKDTAPYMHDGRAETLEDAIQDHEGEAASVRAAYDSLPIQDQLALVAFLNDL